MERTSFPADFVWGTATSAYQIEGSPLADGAAPSIWHELTHRKGTIQDGTTGDLACDHYRRYREDVAIMGDLGLKAYRFSIAWPRVFPEPGRLNPKGIDFYARLVDALLEAGIEPFATLFHWDTPTWLERMGGFARRVSVDHAAEYGAAVFRALGDRVKSWITVNEPLVYTFLGYIQGNHAPGHRLHLGGGYHASHHLLLAHARLRELCRAEVQGGRIGIANHNVWISPRDPERQRDVEAAALIDDGANRLYLDALFRGRYPERVVRRLGRFLPRGFERDLEEIHGREDFVGVNYYARQAYRWSWFTPIVHAWEWQDPRAPRSAMWEIYPEGLHLTLRRLQTEYGNPPCYVTENGYPLPERLDADPLDDRERIRYLADHIAAMGRAMAEGADCRGYFHWSLMDNFEWDLGTSMRFGLLRTDFATQARTWRKSAHWYRDLVRANAIGGEGTRDA